MTDIDAILSAAKPAEITVGVCLRGDLVAACEDLQRQLDAAERAAPNDSLAAGGEARRIAEQIEALREQMLRSTVVLRFRALPRRKFRSLVDTHPPRPEEQDPVGNDRRIGVNVDALAEPLIRACLVDPQLTDQQLTRILDELLTDRQYDEVFGAAWAVNRGDVDIPHSPAASRLLRTSGPGSKPLSG